MNIHNIGYLFREGIKSLWKNRTMTIASIGVLVSCLILTGVAAILSINLSTMMKSVEGNNSITIYLDETLPRLTSIQLEEELRKVNNITDIKFVPKEDALHTVMDMLGDRGSILQGLSGDDNFLPDAYTVSMKDLSMYKDTVAQIQAIEGVDKLTDYSNIATKLSNLNQLVRYGSIAIVLILGIVSLFIISNTIKVTMFSRRMEINIMKSVGATNLFVRIPFIVEGVVIGLIAGGISAAVVIVSYDKLIEAIYSIAAFITPVDIEPFTGLITLMYLGAGTLFGLMGGSISIGKYLRKQGEQAIA